MNKNILLTLAVSTGAILLGAAAATIGSAAPRTVATKVPTVRKESAPVDLPPAPTESAVVDAANAFMATLSEQQRTVAQIDLTHPLAAKWSNFPSAVVPRNGVYFRDMNPQQAAAALKVAKAALSAEGFTRFQGVRAADNAFAKIDKGVVGGRGGPGGPGGPGGGGPGGPGGPGGFGQDGPGGRGGDGGPGGQGGPGGFGGPGGQGGRGGNGGPGGGNFAPGKLFGEGNYMIAFLGQPSKTTPWLLQLGGHHIAFNIYYKGKVGAATPYFVGVQPNTWKDENGKVHAPLAPMRDAMHDLVTSLTPEQSTKAHLEARFSDVYVGPGRDGQFPARSEGVPVSELSADSKKLVKQAIDAWTGDSAQAAEYRKLYYAELEQTKIAYSGATGLSQEGDYVRIDGPHVWIEFACQGSDHYHTIWRDRATDYGAEFAF